MALESGPMKNRSLMSALLAVTLCPGAIAAEEFTRAAKAADRAAASDPACSRSRLGDFYWEIGDATRVLASGAQGGDVNAQTVFPIASASKFIFGAYVLQRKGGEAEAIPENVTAWSRSPGCTMYSRASRRTRSPNSGNCCLTTGSPSFPPPPRAKALPLSFQGRSGRGS